MKMPPRDAWNCTLRDFVSIMTYRDKKNQIKEYSFEEQQDLISQFELRGLIG